MVLRICWLVCLLLLFGNGRGQNPEIDSLKLVLDKEFDLDKKVRLYNAIGFKAMIYSRVEAERYQKKLDSIWKEYKHSDARIQGHKLQAKIYRWNDQPQKALEEFIKVLDLQPDSLVIADVKFNLGMVFSSLHLNNKALSNYQDALQIYKNNKNTDQAHNIYNCIADVYNYNLRDYLQAEKYYLKALSSFSFQDEKRKMNTEGIQSLSAIHNNLGVLYNISDKFVKAEEHLSTSLTLAEHMNDSIGIFHTSISLAQMYRKQELYGKSLQILNEFEKNYLKFVPYLQAEFLREWTFALAATGNYKKAFENTDRYAMVRDSLYNSEVLHQVSKVEAQYRQRLEQHQLTLQLQKDQNKVLLWIVGIVGLLSLALMLGLIYMRNHFQIKKQEILSLQAKNKEVLSDAMKQSGFNSVLEGITSELQHFCRNEKLQKGSIERLEEIIKKIGLSHTQFQWEDFEVLFTRVYSGFFNELNRKHSNLTLSERKLCALIKLDFSNLEIAKFLNIEPQSVHVAKSRLRKKMELDKSIDLYYYLGKLKVLNYFF